MTPCAPQIELAPYSKGDVERMGANFYAVYPIAETHRFSYLLTAIDVAEQEMCTTRVTVCASR